MPCDGKNPNCDKRRELLAQLKCLISSMDRKKPCEWDEPSTAQPTCYPVAPQENNQPCQNPVKACRSFELRSSLMWRCKCVRRNGLQDRCMLMDCMGRPECMTKLFPVCEPGKSALLRLTDLGDAEVALRKFYCADKARESALAAYCRLKTGSKCPAPSPCPASSGPSPNSCPPNSSYSPPYQSSNCPPPCSSSPKHFSPVPPAFNAPPPSFPQVSNYPASCPGNSNYPPGSFPGAFSHPPPCPSASNYSPPSYSISCNPPPSSSCCQSQKPQMPSCPRRESAPCPQQRPQNPNFSSPCATCAPQSVNSSPCPVC